MIDSPAGLRAIPRGVWALGFVSLFMDTSSELVHSLLPVFLVSVLGASMTSVGLIEGVAEATALVTKIFSGTLSDYLGRRKALTVLGYGLAAVTKPLFPLAGSVGMVLTARFIDRVGKGIRGAPRDALVADLSPPHLRGASFGLRQSLDTVGAFAGPVIAIIAMGLMASDMRAVFWIAVIPALAAMVVLLAFVDEPDRRADAGPTRVPLRLADVKTLSSAYWAVVTVGAILTLARFSEAFLVLRASDTGLAIMFVPLVLVVMNVAYAASAYPAGVWSDRAGRRVVLLAGVGVLVAADLVLAMASSVWFVMVGVSLWGLHMGLTQGLLATMVTDTAPVTLRGTAFGAFNLVSGVAMLAASVLAGVLWDRVGPTGNVCGRRDLQLGSARGACPRRTAARIGVRPEIGTGRPTLEGWE
jgi:MFS family permease